MASHPLAGKHAPAESLVDPAKLVAEYHARRPDAGDPAQAVSFGTSGHRGTSLDGTFTESHILAVTQALCEYRHSKGIDGPLYVGADTHALSAPAQRTAVEVLAANGAHVILHAHDRPTPTPAISHAILAHNKGRTSGLADGIVITPSHNPPGDGGFKYNPPNGGPADTDVTGWVQDRANALLRENLAGVKRTPWEQAHKSPHVRHLDLMKPYVDDLSSVVDIGVIKTAKVRVGVDPLGGASVHYWPAIAERWGLDITVVNTKVDPRFGFMTLDHDGVIRMDCSSPHAMAGLVGLKERYAVAFGNDPDADRHGIVTRAGLMNPNHYLAVAVNYLFTHRPHWPAGAGIGKTLVSSSMIDRVAAKLGRRMVEVPVGFKWFVNGLFDGSLGFGGEESAGASFLRRDGTVWSTDKDGIILNLLAAEITAVTGRDPAEHYRLLTREFGAPLYTRIDQPATPAQKAALKKLSPASVTAGTLAGDPITAKLTAAPGNNAPIGGLKVVTAHGWFAARPSGTENIYKIYAESFRDAAHLARIVEEARAIVSAAMAT